MKNKSTFVFLLCSLFLVSCKAQSSQSNLTMIIGKYELVYERNTLISEYEDVLIEINDEYQFIVSYIDINSEHIVHIYEPSYMLVNEKANFPDGCIEISKIISEQIFKGFDYYYYENDTIQLRSYGVAIDSDGLNLGYSLATFSRVH